MKIPTLEQLNERIRRQCLLIVDLAEWIENSGLASDKDVPLLKRAIEEIGMKDEIYGQEYPDIPAGTIMQFYGDTLPPGWERWADAPKTNEFGVPYEKPIWMIKTQT
jgi:hypothetical protein